MRCPFCGALDTAVKDSRVSEDEASIRRRRFCGSCGARFTTYERVELRQIMVQKRDGALEPFDREKLTRSVRTALRKRPIDQNQMERIVSALIRQLETRGEAEITTHMIGQSVLDVLEGLDPVAYIRFASVYKEFDSIKDFKDFISGIQDNEKV